MALRYDPITGTWVEDGVADISSPGPSGSSPSPVSTTPGVPYPEDPSHPNPPIIPVPAPDPDPLPPPVLPEPPTRPGPGGPPSGPGTVPGTTNYPIPGGKQFFAYPDFAPSAINYPDWTPPAWGLGGFEAPTPTAGRFEAPTPTAGEWKAPAWDVGPPPELSPFDYPDFQGPTAETFKTDPGYEFRAREMQRAIENAASARGLLSTGGTLQDLMTARGSLASQEYGNIWNRQLATHQENKNAALIEHDRNEQAKVKAYELKFGAGSEQHRRALEDYNTRRAADEEAQTRALRTYGARRSADDAAFQRSLAGYQTNYAGEQDKFTRGLTSYLTGYGRKADDWNRERDIYATNLGKEATGYGLNLDTGRLNLARDDSRWNNLLSLYGIATRTMPTYNPMPFPNY